MTDMRYRTIVADPPWAYDEGFAGGQTNHYIDGRPRTRAEQEPPKKRALPYPSMPVNTITQVPIRDFAAIDCRMFLWTTNRYLPDAFHVLTAWGFSYRQTLVWDKRPNFSPFSGSVAPNAAEFLLVAVKGRPARLERWTASVVTARRPRTTHSVKPDAFLDLVEQVSPGPYLELFARRQRLGWDTWGDEALNHVQIEAS